MLFCISMGNEFYWVLKSAKNVVYFKILFRNYFSKLFMKWWFILMCRICYCHLISAVLTCDRVFRNYLLGMSNACHGQSGSAKSRGSLVYFFSCLWFLELVMFICCRVVASNARWHGYRKRLQECEMFRSQTELQISLPPFKKSAGTLLQ